MGLYFLIIGFVSLVGFLVTAKLKSKFNQYARIGIQTNLTGAEVAKLMLDQHGIRDVKIVESKGYLSDHYNPKTKTVALSAPVFRGRSVASAAVAAHESGHALQHAKRYGMLKLRSSLVPIMQMSTRAQQIMLIAMIAGYSAGFGGNVVFTVLTVTFGITALFSFVTLPVEFDATNRALAWVEQSGIVQGAEYDGAKDALWWAAMTYVSKALGSLLLVLFFAFTLFSKSQKN